MGISIEQGSRLSNSSARNRDREVAPTESQRIWKNGIALGSEGMRVQLLGFALLNPTYGIALGEGKGISNVLGSLSIKRANSDLNSKSCSLYSSLTGIRNRYREVAPTKSQRIWKKGIAIGNEGMRVGLLGFALLNPTYGVAWREHIWRVWR